MGSPADRLGLGRRRAFAAAARRGARFRNRRLPRRPGAQRHAAQRCAGSAAFAGLQLNRRCATSGRCYPHGTEMAGTIGGRMDNGIGVAGVAPQQPAAAHRDQQGGSRTARAALDHRRGRSTRPRSTTRTSSTSAPNGPWTAARSPNRCVPRSRAGMAKRRLLVTGYATSLDSDDIGPRVLPLAVPLPAGRDRRRADRYAWPRIVQSKPCGRMRTTAGFRHPAWTSS